MYRLRVTAAFCLIGVINQVAVARSPNIDRVRPVYRAGTIPDPLAAHQVALALGEGKHIVVRLYSGKTHRGQIQSIQEGQFQVRLDRSDKLLAISFDQVAYLEQNHPESEDRDYSGGSSRSSGDYFLPGPRVRKHTGVWRLSAVS